MRSKSLTVSVLATSALACLSLSAEVMDRPVGISIGQRMTLKPYVAASTTFDSNAEGRDNGGENVFWTVSPGFGLDYKGDSWTLLANVQYQYNAYAKKRLNGPQNYHGISENVAYRWSDSAPGERGWSLMLAQTYSKTYEDGAQGSGGLEYGTDRQAVNLAAALQRRFGSDIHADANANYYWLDYDSKDTNMGVRHGPFGWERIMGGGEVGWAPSKWTDFLIAGSYQYYKQDNSETYIGGYKPSNESKGFTVQGGLGSYATDHITYRVLAGWSRFEYGGGSSGMTSDGFTYTASSNWTISETWRTMLFATSFYQPTEREYGSSQRVDALTWGLAHSMVRGKLQGMFDIEYRHENPEYSWRDGNGKVSSADYSLDIVTFRLSLTYVINRYMSLFSSVSYRDSCGRGASSRGDAYTYDRYSGTLGVKFTY